MTNKEMKKVAIKASVFAIVSISLMLIRSATKHIMITDAAGVQIDRGSSENAYTLLVDKNVPRDKSDVLIIPLPKSVSSDNIVLEDGYIDHQLRIYIDSREEGFYKDNAIVTDLDIIKSALCVEQNDTGSVCLDFELDNLYANESTLTESSAIEVKFCRPSEKYDRIVAVDTDSTLRETALLLKNIASRDPDNDIKFYFTSQTDETVSTEIKEALVKDCQADLLIGISEGGDNADNGLTCCYNDRYFLRRLTNARFADIVERSCAVTCALPALGVVPAEDDELLETSEIPSARLKIGFDAVAEGENPAAKEDMNKVAQGVYNAVLEAFEVME